VFKRFGGILSDLGPACTGASGGAPDLMDFDPGWATNCHQGGTA